MISKKRLLRLIQVSEYIVSCDNKEYFDYTDYCVQNGFDSRDIQGTKQSQHVYAKALVGLDMVFPTDCVHDLDGSQCLNCGAMGPDLVADLVDAADMARDSRNNR